MSEIVALASQAAAYNARDTYAHVSEFWRQEMYAARDARWRIKFSWKRTIGSKFKFGEFVGTNYCGNREGFSGVSKTLWRGLQVFGGVYEYFILMQQR